ADIKEEADRIERNDRGQERRGACGAADHQIADAQIMQADPSTYRRRYTGVIEIELGLVLVRCRSVERSGGGVHLCDALVIGLFRGVGLLTQLGGASELGLGEIEIGLGLGKSSLGRFERELEWLRLDDKQQVALLDCLAVNEVDRLETAADPGPDIDRVHRLELAGE